jgi:hypothetical protein
LPLILNETNRLYPSIIAGDALQIPRLSGNPGDFFYTGIEVRDLFTLLTYLEIKPKKVLGLRLPSNHSIFFYKWDQD